MQDSVLNGLHKPEKLCHPSCTKTAPFRQEAVLIATTQVYEEYPYLAND
jgi:hypothetical protein